jgi:hypothetical protein
MELIVNKVKILILFSITGLSILAFTSCQIHWLFKSI